MVSLYKQLFSPASTGDEEKDLEIQAKIRFVRSTVQCTVLPVMKRGGKTTELVINGFYGDNLE